MKTKYKIFFAKIIFKILSLLKNKIIFKIKKKQH